MTTFRACISGVCASCNRDRELGFNGLCEECQSRKPISWYFWKFVHNAVIHPLLSLPWEPKWVQRAHDWTAKRCWGGG